MNGSLGRGKEVKRELGGGKVASFWESPRDWSCERGGDGQPAFASGFITPMHFFQTNMGYVVCLLCRAFFFLCGRIGGGARKEANNVYTNRIPGHVTLTHPANHHASGNCVAPVHPTPLI